jgi:hypothetical protein
MIVFYFLDEFRFLNPTNCNEINQKKTLEQLIPELEVNYFKI